MYLLENIGKIMSLVMIYYNFIQLLVISNIENRIKHNCNGENLLFTSY